VLADGRSPAPRAVGDLLIALRRVGAVRVSPPVCSQCFVEEIGDTPTGDGGLSSAGSRDHELPAGRSLQDYLELLEIPVRLAGAV
jgi:hypothetical protein